MNNTGFVLHHFQLIYSVFLKNKTLKMTTWQSQIKGLCNGIEYIMRQEKYCDVTFVFGEAPNQHKVRAHKILLAIRSSVFEERFYGSSAQTENEIVISDPKINVRIFRIMLKYIYTDNIESDRLSELLQLYYLAYKYQIHPLLIWCRNKIIQKLDTNNVCVVYENSLIFKDEIMRNACKPIISKQTVEVIQTEAFIQLALDSVITLLRENEMSIPTEIVIFEAAIRWTKEQLANESHDISPRNIRIRMNPFLPLIRFLTMSLEELFQGPETTGIFKEGEIMKIAKNITNFGSSPLPDWCCTNKQCRIPPKNF